MNSDELFEKVMKQESVYYEPAYSPWGEVQSYTLIAKGIFDVNTASHGGILILTEYADHLLTEDARKCGSVCGCYLCFEEDCAAPVAIRELLDKGIMKAPVNQYYKEGEYSATIDGVIAAWHKDYLQAVEERKAAEQKEKPSQPKQKKTRSREER